MYSLSKQAHEDKFETVDTTKKKKKKKYYLKFC